MRALAYRNESPRNQDVRRLQEAAAVRPEAPRAFLPFAEAPAETSAYWLSRSQTPTFARRRIAISSECARALQDAPGRVVVEFNGASFGGASLATSDGRHELDVGDALAEEMAGVLDEDDGLAVELVTGRSRPTLAIYPYVRAAG